MNKLVCTLIIYLALSTGVHAQESRYMSAEKILLIQKEKKGEEAKWMTQLAEIAKEERPVVHSSQEERVSHALNPFTTHLGSQHFFLSISPSGDLIELEDQSIWSVHPTDRRKMLEWLSTDVLTLGANHDWFSNYTYRLKNQSLGDSLRVNLSMNPVLHNPRTHWIVAMTSSRITLDDGTVWLMTDWDKEITQQWLVNDVVIIGTNEGWFRASYPNTLINTTLLPIAHARGKCQY